MEEKKPYQHYSQKYIYTDLSKTGVSQTDHYNIYGVVIDATSPYIKNKSLCSLKIIDQSLHSKAAIMIKTQEHAMSNTFASLQFFGSHLEELPHVHTMGDIIRIHRVNVQTFKGQKQFNANTFMKSSWVLFNGTSLFREDGTACDLAYQTEVNDPTTNFISLHYQDPLSEHFHNWADSALDANYYPLSSSFARYSFHESERELVDGLRRWAEEYFRTTVVFEPETRIPREVLKGFDGLPYMKDFDLVGKIVKMRVENDQFALMLVKDIQGVSFELRYPTNKFKGLKKGQVIRIRSLKLTTLDQLDQARGTEKTPYVVEMSIQSNIILVPAHFKQAMMLNDKIIDDQTLLYLMLNKESDMQQVLKAPYLASEIGFAFHGQRTTLLLDLFHKSSPEVQDSQFFKVLVFTIGVLPCNIREFSKLFCQQCLCTCSFQGLEPANPEAEDSYLQKYLCPQCQSEDTKAIWMMALLVKDDSTLGMDQVYQIFYYTYQDQVQDFFGGIRPTNLYRNEVVRGYIEQYVSLISKFNVYLQLIIRKKLSQKLKSTLYELYDGKISLKLPLPE